MNISQNEERKSLTNEKTKHEEQKISSEYASIAPTSALGHSTLSR